MLYSDFTAPTLSTSADTAVATLGTITYNGYAKRLLGFWGQSGGAVATAAQGIKPYALITGYGMPGVVPTFPIGRWRSAYLATASVGSVSSDASFLPIDAPADKGQSISIDIRNAASSTAPKAVVGVIYSDGESLPKEWALLGDPWNLREIPKTYIMAGPTSITAAAETSVGTITVPTQYPNIVGLQISGVTNGVRVTAEEFIGTCRYTATGVVGQFEPMQKWPFFGQQDAPVGTDIQDESFEPGKTWHPHAFKAEASSTIQGLVTLQTAISNASSFQMYAALR